MLISEKNEAKEGIAKLALITPLNLWAKMKYDLPYLLLSTQRALLGMVTPELRALIVDLDEQDKKMNFYFYYDGELTDELFDLASCVATEASAAFPSDFLSDEEITRLDFPRKIPVRSGRFAYRRKE